MPRIERKHPDEAIMSGFPGDGDQLNTRQADPPENDPPVDPPPPVDPVVKQLQEMQAKLDRQAEEITQLRRATPPPAVKEPQAPADDDIDWDQEFFASPKKALARHAEIVEKKVTDRLTAAYGRDRSTQAFWDQFYGKHPDLKTDHDLVDITLKSNLGEMSSMSVDKAMERLADLTRERILRYAGNNGKPRAPKPKAEGASSSGGGGKPTKPTEDKIMSITDIINRNKDRRRRAAAGA